MSTQYLKEIEKVLIKASMEGRKVHWGKIYAYSSKFLAKQEKQEIERLAKKWGVVLID